MMNLNSQQLPKRHALVLLALFTIGLPASTITPAFAQASGTWTTTGDLNSARAGHTATLLANGQVLVAGGTSSAGSILSSAELYNPTTGKWTISGSMTTGRTHHTATLLLNGEVLVAGGTVGTDSNFQPIYSATAEVYSPFTGQWRSVASMTRQRSGQGATLLVSGQVLAAGGYNSDGTAATTAELYDPTMGTWKATGNMQQGHASPLTLLHDGRVLVADNIVGEVYDPRDAQWKLTKAMYFPGHSGVSAALLANGDVLIYGNTLPSYASEFYDPSGNSWARTFGQTIISHGPLALIGTGKVLLAGGKPKYGTVENLCLLYDPSRNYWTGTGSLNQPRAGHTLTRLLNGQVLAAGGAGLSGVITSAELYTP